MPRPEHPGGNDSREPTVVLSESDAREAARLFKLLAGAIGDTAAGHGLVASRDDLVLRARVILNSRRQRTRYFNRAMFGEPGWDVLLVLYVTERADGRQPIGRLAEWIQTPLSTVVRWVDYLVKERLVAREPHPTDKRIIFIRLRQKGRELLERYLGAAPWLDEFHA